MAIVIAALAPVFLLIVLGVVLKRTLMRLETQWHGLEQLTYYVLFPMLLIQTLVKADLGKVQVDIQAEEAADPESKWSKLRITKVELLDGRGRPVDRVATGEAVTFRLHYATTEPVLNPVFGLAISTPEGMVVTGPNTKEAKVQVDKVDGEGTVDMHVERLLLLLGAYDITAACTNDSVTHTYDQAIKALRFDVRPGVPHETYGGVVSLDGRWSID